MCILIHHPKNTVFSSEQIADFYYSNSDGFGAIVKDGATVEVIKSVGTLAEINALYNKEVAGKEAIIHLRMKTHGEINLANCHPYEVIHGLWMAHNGILRQGYNIDPKMSDTWQFIQTHLRPILSRDPSMIHNHGFQALIEDSIGASNKFAFMDEQGAVVIINKDAGIVHNDVWYSNTYAWTPWKFGYGKEPAYQYPQTSTRVWNPKYYGTSPTWKAWDALDVTNDTDLSLPLASEYQVEPAKVKVGIIRPISKNALKHLIKTCYKRVEERGEEGAFDWALDEPKMAARFIYEVAQIQKDQTFSYLDSVDYVINTPADAAAEIIDLWFQHEKKLKSIANIT